jgi:hypothetical protein
VPGRRTDALTKRAAVAVAVPTALVALAGTLAFAGPAFAANEAAGTSTTLPFPTTICGTSGSSGPDSSASASASSSSPFSLSSSDTPSTSAQPSASASPSASCLPRSQVKKNSASSGGNVAAEVPWHLTTPSMTMYNLTYNGVTTIQTDSGSLKVLDFTASKVTLLSMVTYSQQGGGRLQYVDSGDNKTVTLTTVHLWSASMTANVLGLLKQTFTPDSPGILAALQGITIPIPLLFTDVDADNAFLHTELIDIPGFKGHGN